MAPIRVGIIGLTAKPDSWAPRAHLAYLLKSPHYIIQGVCNSSLSSTKAAIEAHDLPPDTHAFDSVKALTADPSIDLVVISTRVDTHYALAKPALISGKDTFVEWPLASNLSQARDLLALAKQHKVRTAIGLQGRMSPLTRRLRDIVHSDRIGKTYSVSVLTTTNTVDTTGGEKYAYFADRSVGGNMLTIHSMHLLDIIFSVHGELKSWTPVAANQIPYMDVRFDDGSVKRRSKDSPDQVIVSGRFDSGAVFSYHIRRGVNFPGAPGLIWRVYGEKGQLDIEGESAGVIQLGIPVKVRYYGGQEEGKEGGGGVEEIVTGSELEGDEWMELPMVGRNIGRIYEAFAKGEEGSYGDWELAVKRHEFVERVYQEGGID